MWLAYIVGFIRVTFFGVEDEVMGAIVGGLLNLLSQDCEKLILYSYKAGVFCPHLLCMKCV